jgi:hypothetical protein
MCLSGATCLTADYWLSELVVLKSILVYYNVDIIIISSNVTCSCHHLHSWKIAHLALNNNHSLVYINNEGFMCLMPRSINDILVILWWSVLSFENNSVPGKTIECCKSLTNFFQIKLYSTSHPATSHRQSLSHTVLM